MKLKTKILLIAIVGILSVMALVVPRLSNRLEFQTTSQPQTAFNQAQKSGKPIFLEFYAKW